ncbi:MAG: outer membrane beta-barrel protein [Verrucomicrobiota bacterium]
MKVTTILLMFGFCCLATASLYSQANVAAGQEYRSQEAQGVSAAQQTKAESKRPLTVTAQLREEYDDNIYTTKTNKKSQFKTIVEPSLVYNLPLENTLLSARYTYGMTYFPDRGAEDFDHSHEWIGRIDHSFSSRFNIDVRDRLRYSQEPDIVGGDARSRRTDSTFLSNIGSIQGNMQWTPKLGTATTFTNDNLDYDDLTLEKESGRMINSLTHDFRYLMTPTITLVAGGFSNLNDYFYANKDSTTIGGSFGADYSLSPQITVGARVGPSYTDLDDGTSYWNPYGNIFGSWTLGARSSVEASYTHSVTETDSTSYYLQESDSFTLTGRYQFTPKFYGRLGGRLTLGSFESDLGTTAGTRSTTENVLGMDGALGFKLSEYIDLEAGYGFSYVSSDDKSREYDRNQLYLSIRGTY